MGKQPSRDAAKKELELSLNERLDVIAAYSDEEMLRFVGKIRRAAATLPAGFARRVIIGIFVRGINFIRSQSDHSDVIRFLQAMQIPVDSD